MTTLLETVFDASWAWLIAGVAIAGLEILVPGVFLLWIGLGALATGLVLTLLPDLPLAWQLAAFAGNMLAAVGMGILLQRKAAVDPAASMLNRELAGLVGTRTVATTAFAAGRGRIRIQDTTFAASSADTLAPGDLVEIVGIENDQPVVRRAEAAGEVPLDKPSAIG